ncbi:MAG TPA: DUF2892 domain-containing protein [Planctomycetaceae bacterium]|jgi:uncharacterized membrane protein|nr:DUF2892 domain-containing protein [Planctomycetaceae bacterium]
MSTTFQIEEQVMQPSPERTSQECCQANVAQMERLASVIAGGTILMTMGGLRSVRGAAATAIGAGLIWRGLTGHCGVYDRLGIDTAEMEKIAATERAEA